MRKQSDKPIIPIERRETLRQQIISILEGNILSAKEISGKIKISEKEVYTHLEHILRSTNRKDSHLTMIPSQCKKCGFVYKKREKLAKPGKCPVCRGEAIQEPLFSMKKNG